MVRNLVLSVTPAVLLQLATAEAATPLSEIVTHPELEVSLFAMEPDVVDPVALCFDASGRMYVVEMRDYPYGIPPENQPGGTIRLLEDTDRDGKADRSVLFADGLPFPTSIAPYRDGVLVTAPPSIFFLKDTDGDGRADVREELYKGFRRGVTDGNMSGLRWGIDNTLHGVNGGHGGNVYSPRNKVEPLRLGDLDFRLRPDTGGIETTFSTGGGFGLVFDEWGRSFTPHNTDHMQMRILPAAAVNRHPGFPPVEGTESISDHEAMARIYPISQARTRPNHPEQAGYFSSGGGVGYIGHQGYPGDLAGSVTVCDVVGNLVHRDVLGEDGPVLRASRAPGEQTREFIASTDPAFRPTGLELGPDGALYLIDMHREVIEHPDYIPAKMLNEMDIRAGDTQGRIYRILPTSGVRQDQSRLDRMTPNELVEELASPNQWRRMTAQRLIVEQNHLIASVPLRQVVTTHVNPLARVHALWSLAGIGELGESTLLSALDDADPGVQENALWLAAGFTADSESVRQRVRQIALDGPTARVRFVAIQLINDSDADTVRDAVSRLLRKDGGFKWSRRAALAALHGGEVKTLHELTGDPEFIRNPAATDVLNELADLAGGRWSDAAPDEINALLKSMQAGTPDESLTLAVVNGLRNGLARNPSQANSGAGADNLETLASAGTPAVRRAVWALEKQLGLPASPSQAAALKAALAVAADREQPVPSRVEAIELLAIGDPTPAVPILLGCLDGTEPPEIQRAAFAVLQSSTKPEIAAGFIARWRGIHPSLKHEVVLLMLRKRDYHDPLLTAIEQEQLTLGELNLDLEDRRRLLRWSTPAIQERARKLLGDGEYGNRQAKVEEWLNQLPENGNAGRGREIFQNTCAQCHKVGELGHDVGPNLTGLSHRSIEDLVSNILDPNMAINPNYLGVTIETQDGELLTGILAAETGDALTLLQAQGLRTVVRRDQIKRFESTGTSLMPEGLEAGLTPEKLRDLLAFLQQ